jgi:hypothetical protein
LLQAGQWQTLQGTNEPAAAVCNIGATQDLGETNKTGFKYIDEFNR